jgi:hypothetical protein
VRRGQGPVTRMEPTGPAFGRPDGKPRNPGLRVHSVVRLAVQSDSLTMRRTGAPDYGRKSALHPGYYGPVGEGMGGPNSLWGESWGPREPPPN